MAKTVKKIIKPIKKKSAPDSRLAVRRRQEIVGLMLIYLGLMIFLALLSYKPAENPGELQINQSSNIIGFAGSYIAFYLIKYTIGFPVLVIPLLLMFIGGMLLLAKPMINVPRWTRHILFLAFYTSIILALPEANLSDGTYYNLDLGGWLGHQTAKFLITFLGFAGCIIFLIGVMMVMVISATRISFSQMIAALSVLLNSAWLAIMEWQRRYRQNYKTRRQDFFQQPEHEAPKPPQYEQPMQQQTEVAQPQLQQPAPAQQQSEQMELNIEKTTVPQVAGPEAPSEDRIAPREYAFPPVDLLNEPKDEDGVLSKSELLEKAHLLEARLREFGVRGRVVEINPGPVITRYELEPATGVKVSQFTSLADDLALVMRAKRIRIVAPIPGKAAIGIEIPNPRPATVYLQDIIDSEEFDQSQSVLSMAIGKTISGDVFTADLATMPHLLIGGSTGSGKSVCLNTIIASILFKAHPSQVQFVLIDPKRLELSAYARLKEHHLTYLDGLNEYVITSSNNAVAVLRSLEAEMERRYKLLNELGMKNIEDFNKRAQKGQLKSENGTVHKRLEYIVLIIDELADLMLSAAREVEEPIARLTQMSRAVGIHLIVATQRPSVDVLTGVIKANFPARISFQVASKVDSRTILDMNGAEKLLGKGDMLFLPPASPEPIRLHNAYVSTDEIERIIQHIRSQPAQKPKFTLPPWYEEQQDSSPFSRRSERDPLFADAARIVVTHQQGSVSILQRRLKVGYSRAARLIDELEEAGIVGPYEGSKAREVLVDEPGFGELGIK